MAVKKNFKKMFSFFLIIITVLTIVPTYTTIPEAAKKNPREITLNFNSKTLTAGKSLKLRVKGFAADSSKFIWTSSNKNVATVSNKGKVTAENAGSATITAKLKSNRKTKASCTLKIYNQTNKIELISDDQYIMSAGDVLKLHARVSDPQKYTRPIVWKSNDKNVAEISSTGIVTAVGEGSTVMTASSGQKNVSVKITVKPSSGSDQNNYGTTADTPSIPDVIPVVTYRVVFNTNGGSYIESQKIEKGKTAARPSSPSRQGYIFAGWYKDSMFSLPYDFSSAVTEDISLYAKWNYTEQTSCKIVFHTNGGSTIPSQTVEKGKTPYVPANPVKNGYTFAGWYKDSTLTVSYSLADPVNEDITVYAKWDKGYIAAFNTNGGNYINSQFVGYLDSIIRPADPVRYGYIFAGWYADSSLTRLYDFTSAVTQDIVLYARWVVDNNYTYPVIPTVPTYPVSSSTYRITFESRGGSEVASQAVTERQFAKRPDTPKKNGYVFTGWYTSLDFDEIFIFEYTPVMKDITLYAGWIENGSSVKPDNPSEPTTPTVPTMPTDSVAPITPTTPTVPTNPGETKKNEGDVAALKKIIQDQKARGAIISEDIDDYSWYNIDGEYRLTDIHWNNKYLSGDISFDGLPYLSTLWCTNNNLNNLDVSNNAKLTTLYCYDNNIKSLDISNNLLLEILDCYNNNISELILGSNTSLTHIRCGRNLIQSMDLSECISLLSLECIDNKLITLNMSNNSSLNNLLCDDNEITKLNLSNNILLTTLSCGQNQLSKLNLNNNINLKDINCYSNNIDELVITNCSMLKTLNCYNNKLTKLDISNNKNLTSIRCGMNNILELDVRNNKMLKDISCDPYVVLIGKQ